MIKALEKTAGVVPAHELIIAGLLLMPFTAQADFLGSDQYNYGTHDEATGALLGPPVATPRHFDMEFADPNTLYLGDDYNVHRINANTGMLMGSFSTSQYFGDMEFMSNGDLMIAGNGSLNRYDALTGQFLGEAGIQIDAIDIEFLANGELLITDGNVIQRVDPLNGSILSSTVFGPVVDLELMSNGDLLVGRDGSFLHVDPMTWQVFAEHGTGIGSFIDMEMLNGSELLFVGLPGITGDGRVVDPLTGQFIRDISMGLGANISDMEADIRISSVPVPAAVWLFGSGLLGLIAITRRNVAIS